MGAQGIHLRDPGHKRHQRGTHRSSGSHQIPVLHRLPDQLLGDDIHHGEPVFDDGVKLLLQPVHHDLRKVFPIQLMGPAITDVGQRLVAVRNDRRAFVRPHRGNGFHLIRDEVGIGDHHFFRLFAAQILKLLQHLLRGAQIQRRLLIRVLEPLSGHDNPAVDLVRRIQKMHVAGGHHGLVELLTQPHDPAVNVLDVLHGSDILNTIRIDHEQVVARGLNLQIIVKIDDPGDLRIGLFIQEGPIEFPRFAGAAQNQSLPIFCQKTLRHPRRLVKVVQMGFRNQPVQVHPADVVFCQKNRMIRRQPLHQIRAGIPQPVHVR